MASTAPSRARHRTPSLEVTGSVVAAAVRIIGADGVDALTVRRLAAEADVAPMTIYNRFVDMHGVFNAVFQHGFTVFADSMRASGPSPDPMDDLNRMCTAYRAFARSNPELYRFMFLHDLEGIEPTDDSWVAASQAFGVLLTAVTRAVASERILPGDPSVIAQEIWATCHGAVALELLGMCAFADPETTYNALIDTLLRGLIRDREGSAAPGGHRARVR